MDSHAFKVNDRVSTPKGAGTVTGFHDWWVMVKLDRDDVRTPFMEPELTYVAQSNS